MEYLLGLALLAAAAAALVLPSRLRRRRRDRLFRSPLPERHRRIVERNLPLYARMPPELREELGGHINVFLDEKQFLGCGGLEPTEEMCVTIAAHACLLLLNREPRYFPGSNAILLYPGTYLVDEVTYDGEVEISGQDARAGESWHLGPVVLSWADVERSFSHDADGTNVVLHEFAHKLDEENPDAEALPVLGSASDYADWERVLSYTWEHLEESLTRHEDPALDDYALTSPAEFFAVATESFFERAADLKAQFPDLYAQFRRYYRVDPANWGRQAAPAR